MSQRSIVELIEEKIDDGGIDLPVFDRIALRIRQMLSRHDYNASELTKVIEQDQALASQILKVANSAFYTGLKQTKTIRDALVRIGSKGIINLVMVATQNESYRSQKKEFRIWMNPLWSHALGTAIGSRWLALHLGLNRIAEECFLAGLLHDIGKLLLLRIIEDLQKSESIPPNISSSIIKDILEDMHCDKGERLMLHLNMPEIYCLAVGRHHNEDEMEDNPVMNLVKLANQTCHKLGIGLKQEPGLMLSTTTEAMNLMATDLLLAELQVKLEEYKFSVDRIFRQC